ncbi:MAG: Gfo/Idh/MocA family protein [Candidatus Hinthialibacter sp.]
MKKTNHLPSDRRSFLRSSALIGSGLVMAPALKARAQKDPIHVGLVGAGTQGQTLLNACMKIEGVQVKALCDIWEAYNLKRASSILSGFKQEHQTYADYKEMLAGKTDLDAVLIATPDFCHAEQTAACLQAGLHVYCESMMSNTLEGARAMTQAAKASGKLLQIGHQRRSNPYYRFGYEHILHETKMLGKTIAMNGQWNRAVQPERGFPRRAVMEEAALNQYGYASMKQFRNWEWYKELGGGPLAQFGAHQIDVFNWFMGNPPKTVTAVGGTDYYEPKTHEWFDTVMAVFEYENSSSNVRGFYQTINSNSSFGYYENVMGDEGTLYLSESPVRVKVYREPAAPDWEKWVKIGLLESVEKKEVKEEDSDAVITLEESVAPPSYNLPVQFTDPVCQPHLENFFQAIRGEANLHCPAETGYAATATVLKIIESVQESKRIELKPDDFRV